VYICVLAHWKNITGWQPSAASNLDYMEQRQPSWICHFLIFCSKPGVAKIENFYFACSITYIDRRLHLCACRAV
jgi:hypothetical protein